MDEIPFSASFPLPFRVLFLVGLGLVGWAANLHGLEILGVDAAAALELKQPESLHSPLPVNRPQLGFRQFYPPSTLHSPIYRIFIAYLCWCFLAWALFRYAISVNVLLVDVFKYIPAICALFVATILVAPLNILYKRERDRFIHSIWRCVFSPTHHPVHFSDVVFADILTSFAKVLGDVWLSICMLWPGNSLLDLPTTDGWTQWILPTIMSIPYLVRLRQCIIEYMASSNESRRPLFNALKYASSFPVIFLSAAQRMVISDLAESGGHVRHPLFRLWLLSAAVNSLYSFWWDVTNDWGLDLLRPKDSDKRRKRANSPPRPLLLPSLHSKSSSLTGSPLNSSTQFKEDMMDNHSRLYTDEARRMTHPYGLRSILLYPLPVYPLIVFLDLVLRLTWSIKLSSHLHSQSEGSLLIFWLEMGEVVRRWMWVFVRVEWEVVKRASSRGKEKARIDAHSKDEYEMVFSAHSNDGI